jgi:hypothetical protein
MARLNEDGQWIVLMGLLVAVGMFFLALIINQSALVGQTTSEGVLEFPKNDIKALRSQIFDYMDTFSVSTISNSERFEIERDVVSISLERKNAIVRFWNGTVQDVSGRNLHPVHIHYNNGVTMYDEMVYY